MAHPSHSVISSIKNFFTKSSVFWILSLILLIGMSVRLVALGSIPLGLYMDEVAILIDARMVSETGMDMHSNAWLQAIFPSYGDYKLPVYIWLAAAAVKLLGASDLAVRLPSALAGIGSIVIVCLIVSELLKYSQLKVSAKWYWLASSLVLAIAPWSILFSRTAFEGHVAQFLVAISVWVALKAKRRATLVVLSAVIGAAATYTYFSVRFVWPVVFIGVSGLFLIDWQLVLRDQKKFLFEVLMKVALPLGIFAVLLMPMFNSPWYQVSDQYRLSTASILNNTDWAVESNVLRQEAGNQFIDRLFLHRHWLMSRALLANMADHLSLNYLYLTGDSNLRHGTQFHGLFLMSLLPMLILGMYHLFDRYKKILWLVLLWWLIALLPASVPETTPHALRSLNALVPLSFIQGFGLAFVANWAWNKRKAWWAKGALVGYSVILTLCFISFTSFYFTVYPALSAQEWNQGYREFVITLEEMSTDEPTIVLDFDQRFFLWHLAYGEYSAEEIQSLPKKAFTPTHLKDVVIVDDVGELELSSIVVIGGRSEEIKKFESDTNGEVLVNKEILSPTGESLFRVIKIAL